jgi:hypothetical protein
LRQLVTKTCRLRSSFKTGSKRIWPHLLSLFSTYSSKSGRGLLSSESKILTSPVDVGKWTLLQFSPRSEHYRQSGQCGRRSTRPSVRRLLILRRTSTITAGVTARRNPWVCRQPSFSTRLQFVLFGRSWRTVGRLRYLRFVSSDNESDYSAYLSQN